MDAHMPFGADPNAGVEPVDPNEDLERFELHPRWDELESLDPTQLALSYDRRSDAMMINFRGRGQPYVAVECNDRLSVLIDPDSERITGLLLEAFLAREVPEHPELIRLLDVSELRGITSAEVHALRREHLGWRERLADVWAEHRYAPAEQKERVTRLIDPSSSLLREYACT